MAIPVEQENEKESVILSPSYRLPFLIILIGIPFLLIPSFSPWPTIIISSFGLFLLLQSLTLRLKFTKNDLIVMQLGRELRRFPFDKWISWRILLPQLPGLLYFREEASPHLLPILFEPKSLEKQLRLKVKDLEINKSLTSNPSEH